MRKILQLILPSLLFLSACQKQERAGHTNAAGREKPRPTDLDRTAVRLAPAERDDLHDGHSKVLYSFMKAGATSAERAEFARKLEADATARGIPVMALVAEMVANAPDEPFQICLLNEINSCYKDTESRLALAAALPSGILRSTAISIAISDYCSSNDFDSGFHLYQGLPVGVDRTSVAGYLATLRAQANGEEAALEFARLLEMPEERVQAEAAIEGGGSVIPSASPKFETNKSLDVLARDFEASKR